MPFNKRRIVVFALCVVLVGSIAGMFWVYSMAQQQRVETALWLLRSERDLNAVMMLKAMKAIHQKKDKDAVRFMETWLSGDLQSGVSDTTLAKAKEFERAYCKHKCLGIEK